MFMDFLVKFGNDILVNEYEINVLKKCNIDVKSCRTIDEILFLIDKYLDEAEIDNEDYDEIDYVANNLAERKYYGSTNK